MPIIRSISFFIPIDNWDNIDNIEEYFNKSVEAAHLIRPRPWTVRYVLPPYPKESSSKECFNKIISIYEKISDKDILIHPLSLNSDSRCIMEIPEILSSTENLYATISLEKDLDIVNIVDAIYLQDLDPNLYTRISITHFKMLQTPYFPSTSNLKNTYGFAFALRYIDIFEKFLEGDESDLTDFIKELYLNLDDEMRKMFFGIDYSLSPWMDESVAYLLERKYGVTLGEPGSYNAVYNLNQKIRELMNMNIVKSIGFNEVMLPVGEDDILKKRVEEGVLRLGLLEGLSSVCVAGLDMIAVRKDENLMRMILYDMDKISRIKKKPIGTRMIPTYDEEKVKLKKFGEIPLTKI